MKRFWAQSLLNPKKNGDRPYFWSLLCFDNPELDHFAAARLEGEIRSGLMTLSLLFLLLLSASAILIAFMGLSSVSSYTYLVLGLLSAHIYFAARSVREVQALYLLGMALLVVSSTALVLQAHQVGAFGLPLYVGLVLVFVVIPLVPWGLREGLALVLIIYIVFTASLVNSPRIQDWTFALLQFFMVSAGMIVLVLVGRNAILRRNEIKSRFQLEAAHAEILKMSYQDPLTGACNRRYLKENFAGEAARRLQSDGEFFFLLFDLDRFKYINDTYGHITGDRVLQWVVESFKKYMHGDDLLVRIGGDEFALITGQKPESVVQHSRDYFMEQQTRQGWSPEERVTLSFGMARVTGELAHISLEKLFSFTDKALYQAKDKGGDCLEKLEYTDVAGLEVSDRELGEGICLL